MYTWEVCGEVDPKTDEKPFLGSIELKTNNRGEALKYAKLQYPAAVYVYLNT